MKNELFKLIDRLAETHSLTEEEYKALLEGHTPQLADYAAEKARETRRKIYGKDVYIRGLIEISNICPNNCFYCGIRRDNENCSRYRLEKADILACCKEGYSLGFRTFVLQGGEDPYFTDDILCDIVKSIKASYPDCAVTLSMGERSRESYALLKAAGADRYLLRHETADKAHYEKLHPAELSFENRMRCLQDLKDLGYQVGCGFMVGSPCQTAKELAKDLKFVEAFRPAMCGIGPFLTHKDTPFRDMPSGSMEMTLFLLSLLRLMHPHLLLPATTALGTIHPTGREKGILAGANVVMPNLSPASVRKKYMLYDNKLSDGAESAEAKAELEKRMASIGYTVVTHRGDVKQL